MLVEANQPQKHHQLGDISKILQYHHFRRPDQRLMEIVAQDYLHREERKRRPPMWMQLVGLR